MISLVSSFTTASDSGKRISMSSCKHWAGLMPRESPSGSRLDARVNRYRVRTDWALMDVIDRLARPHRQDDVANMIGGSRSTVSESGIIIGKLLYKKYVIGSNKIANWKGHFSRCVQPSCSCAMFQFTSICHCMEVIAFFPPARFAEQYRLWGAPYDTLVGMIDGHVQRVCRPGGEGCVNENVNQRVVFLKNLIQINALIQ